MDHDGETTVDESAEDLKRVIELRTKAIRARLMADDAIEAAKVAKEAAKEAETELTMFIDELRRPPPLFAPKAGEADRLDDLNAELNAETLATSEANR
jgi:hypothetical protein